MTPESDLPPEGAAGPKAGPGFEETAAPNEDALDLKNRECEELRTKWLLAQADLDNYRKRVQKEFEQDRLYAVLPLARDILPGLDNLRRTLEAARTAPDVARLSDGVSMVLKQFEDILANHSVKPIEALEKPFDPNLHQAIQQVPTADKPPMTVVAEFQKGYVLHDRVVRPASVVVSAPPA